MEISSTDQSTAITEGQNASTKHLVGSPPSTLELAAGASELSDADLGGLGVPADDWFTDEKDCSVDRTFTVDQLVSHFSSFTPHTLTGGPGHISGPPPLSHTLEAVRGLPQSFGTQAIDLTGGAAGSSQPTVANTQAVEPPVPPQDSDAPAVTPPVPFRPVDTSSEHVAQRIQMCNGQIVTRLSKHFKQLLSLSASEWRLTQLQTEGKVPRSLNVSLPSIRIQSVGQVLEADDATKAMASTVSALLFTQLRTSTTSELLKLRDKFLDSYPRPTQHCFVNWCTLILRARNSPLTGQFQDEISLAHASTAFDSQLRRGFSVLLWDLREALFTAALQMQRRSMAVRKWFKRDEPVEADLGGDAPEPESSLAAENRDLKKRMVTLEQQLTQLRTSVSSLRQQSNAGASSSGRQNRSKKQKNVQQQGGSSSQPPKGRKPNQPKKKGKKGKSKGNKKKN